MTEESIIVDRKKRRSEFEPKGFSGTVYVLLHDIVLVLAAITFVFVFFARLVGVSGSSMYRTLIGGSEYTQNMGDYLILESNVVKHTYKYGDVVVACVPTFEQGKPIVKRVIATGGQEISFHKDETGALRVFIDGVRLEEDYVTDAMMEHGMAVDGASLVVPEGSYFLMGDNRNNSSDSRISAIGVVDERYIVGRARWILIPGQDLMQDNRRDWSRFGVIPQ